MDKKEIRKIANKIKPIFNIGKNGLTETFIDTVDKFLEANRIVKIKCNGATSKEELKILLEELAKKVNSEVVDVKGFTFVLFR